eukprot:7504652-Lingulodinium_polyedra.AAC.1
MLGSSCISPLVPGCGGGAQLPGPGRWPRAHGPREREGRPRSNRQQRQPPITHRGSEDAAVCRASLH